MLSFRKCAMTLIPGDRLSRPRTLYLTHHRAVSEAWNVRTRCRACQHEFQEALRDLASCQVPAPCTCNLCVRQPPSLMASSSHVLFNVICNIGRFEITAGTTYDEYIYEVRTGRVDITRLLPPQYPLITVLLCFDRLDRCVHAHCPGGGPWYSAHERAFDTEPQAI
jgi:hypothetical protein